MAVTPPPGDQGLINKNLHWLNGAVLAGSAVFSYPGRHYALIGLMLALAEQAGGAMDFTAFAGARMAGVGFITVNAILQLLLLPAYPWWAAMLFVLDLLVIYGLIAHAEKD